MLFYTKTVVKTQTASHVALLAMNGKIYQQNTHRTFASYGPCVDRWIQVMPQNSKSEKCSNSSLHMPKRNTILYNAPKSP